MRRMRRRKCRIGRGERYLKHSEKGTPGEQTRSHRTAFKKENGKEPGTQIGNKNAGLCKNKDEKEELTR